MVAVIFPEVQKLADSIRAKNKTKVDSRRPKAKHYADGSTVIRTRRNPGRMNRSGLVPTRSGVVGRIPCLTI